VPANAPEVTKDLPEPGPPAKKNTLLLQVHLLALD
jgi:hypothetical protein